MRDDAEALMGDYDYEELTDDDLDALFGGEWPINTQEMLARLEAYIKDASPSPPLTEAELNETRAEVVFYEVKDAFEYYAETHNRAFDDMKAALLYGDTSGEVHELDALCQALRRVLNRLAQRCVESADLWAETHAAVMEARARDLEAQTALAEGDRAFLQIEKSAEVARNVVNRLRDPAMRRAWADEKLLEHALPPRPINWRVGQD
ncbi:MAG: hypothetical protein Kow00120_02570 [Anaerolineae bacterium]